MDTVLVYNQCHYRQLDTAETLERMLEKWYKNYLYRLEHEKAQEALVHVLNQSRIKPNFVAQIVSVIDYVPNYCTKL